MGILFFLLICKKISCSFDQFSRTKIFINISIPMKECKLENRNSTYKKQNSTLKCSEYNRMPRIYRGAWSTKVWSEGLIMSSNTTLPYRSITLFKCRLIVSPDVSVKICLETIYYKSHDQVPSDTLPQTFPCVLIQHPRVHSY